MANDTVWRQEVQALAGQSSAVIKVPGWVDQITATAIPNGGTATVQHTTDDPDNITNWINWDEGPVTVNTTQAAMGAVTALRINAVGATVTLKVAGIRKRQ